MKSNAEWDGYGSYEAYINRGLGGIFNTNNNEGAASGNTKQPIKPIKSQRTKPKDAYEIVASHPHHEGDESWLVQMLLKLPLAKRQSVMLRYGQVYNSAQSAVVAGDGKEGHARRDANAWLLSYVEQCRP